MKYRCVIFDCDGTLVDTLEDIASAMNMALVENGFPVVALENYRDIVGWGIIRLAELALPNAARTKETIRLVSNCSMLRQCLALIPCILIFGRIWGLWGVVAAAPVADGFSLIVTGTMIFFELRKLRGAIADGSAATGGVKEQTA